LLSDGLMANRVAKSPVFFGTFLAVFAEPSPAPSRMHDKA
jgi:hypothetical protein